MTLTLDDFGRLPSDLQREVREWAEAIGRSDLTEVRLLDEGGRRLLVKYLLPMKFGDTALSWASEEIVAWRPFPVHVFRAVVGQA